MRVKERNTGIQTQVISQINTSESFVNIYLTPTRTNYSPENQTNTRYGLGLSPHLDQQSFENSSSRKTKDKTSVAQMEN